MGRGNRRVSEDGDVRKGVGDDLVDLPPEIAQAMQRQREIDALSATSAKHYVYRYLGENSSSPKELVMRIDNVMEVPDADEVGRRVKRAGLYMVMSSYTFQDEDGESARKNFASPVFRIAQEYEVGAAPAAAPAAQAAGIPDTFAVAERLLGTMIDGVVKMKGEAPPAAPPDVVALQRSFDLAIKESERRVDSIREEYEDRLRRVLKDQRDAGKGAAGGGLTDLLDGDKIEKFGDAVGSGMKVIREVADIFKGRGAEAEGGEA